MLLNVCEMNIEYRNIKGNMKLKANIALYSSAKWFWIENVIFNASEME